MKNILKNIKANLSFSFKGRFSQFNIMLFIFMLLILGFGYFFYKFPNQLVSGIGLFILLIIFCVLIKCALAFFARQENRSPDGNTSSILIETPEGSKLKLINPPDTSFHQKELQGTLRAMMVSYDPNFGSDGEVIGDSSKEKYRWYDDDEKKEFQRTHKNEIVGKKSEIAKLIHETENNETQDSNPSKPETDASIKPQA